MHLVRPCPGVGDAFKAAPPPRRTPHSKEAGFDVKLLVNAEASRAAVLRELRSLARGMGINDSVVVYYSGSSQVDTAARRAWWLPSDAMLGDKSSWISGRELQEVVTPHKETRKLIVRRCLGVWRRARAFFCGPHLDCRRRAR